MCVYTYMYVYMFACLCVCMYVLHLILKVVLENTYYYSNFTDEGTEAQLLKKINTGYILIKNLDWSVADARVPWGKGYGLLIHLICMAALVV